MKDNKTMNVAALLLIAAITVCNVSQLEALSVEETCQIVENESYIGVPTDCQSWAYCLNGEPYYGKCGDGFLFDSARGACDYPDKVTCTANVENMCANKDAVYLADPYNCQSYIYCRAGVSYPINCNEGQNYNPSTQTCVWATNSSCQASSPCLLAKNGFVKDSSSCAGWFRCANGVVVHKDTCDITLGLGYNAYTARCEYDVPCDLPGGTTPGNKPIDAKPPPNACADFPNTNFTIDSATCRGYFICRKLNDDEPIWGQCPEGTNFNVDTQECNLPFQVACPYDRCDGITEGFMAAYDSECKSYIYCKNGIEIGSKTECPKGYGYFNEAEQVCQELPWITDGICAKVGQ